MDHLLKQYFRILPLAATAFIVFHYSPPLTRRGATPRSPCELDNDLFEDDGTGGDDRDAIRCASVVFMSPTTVMPSFEISNTPPVPSQGRNVESSDSLLAWLSVHSPTRKHNKNAIIDHAGPKQYQRLVSLSPSLYPPTFTRALIDKVEPFVNSVIPTMNYSRSRHERFLYEVTWTKCPVPLPSSSPINLCIWKRNGCLLIYPQPTHDTTTNNTTAHTLFDSLEALSRFSFKLQT